MQPRGDADKRHGQSIFLWADTLRQNPGERQQREELTAIHLYRPGTGQQLFHGGGKSPQF